MLTAHWQLFLSGQLEVRSDCDLLNNPDNRTIVDNRTHDFLWLPHIGNVDTEIIAALKLASIREPSNCNF